MIHVYVLIAILFVFPIFIQFYSYYIIDCENEHDSTYFPVIMVIVLAAIFLAFFWPLVVYYWIKAKLV